MSRMPVVYVPHGGGPWPYVDLPMFRDMDLGGLRQYLEGLRHLAAPKAVLVISAHWEAPVPTVQSSAHPPLLFDYYGFPPESYALTWPAPGDPQLAARVRALLADAGIPSAEDPKRGFDHGTFVPLKLTWPDAQIPTIQLSLKQGLNAAEHLAMGRALRPLRDEGVLILGSGMSYHNMRGFGGRARATSKRFDDWLGETAILSPQARDERLANWENAPAARECHPREEHLLPLMVIAGAAGQDVGTVPFNEVAMGVFVSAVQFG